MIYYVKARNPQSEVIAKCKTIGAVDISSFILLEAYKLYYLNAEELGSNVFQRSS